MYQIEIANEQDSLDVELDYIEEVVNYVLSVEKVTSAEISVALISDSHIHELNRTYLNHDYETDVLSFLLEESGGDAIDDTSAESLTADKRRGEGKRIVGEVIVSTETAIRSAESYNWRSIDELTLYLVHGVLHLLGYDDLSENELEIMRFRENELLLHWQLTPTRFPSVTEPTMQNRNNEPLGGSS